ncbi:family 43 glycosylhydrolase [Cohnella panacarvi]|uniref:family 43 glycosylhydrolase n=1 Tax=Cohnella panacarvi TaxID=400776 RepID=UPI000479412D|nr:family 43 glycosylhydrolase [Cohnella panacarvi]
MENVRGNDVEVQTSDWYMVHLCGRPLTASRMCDLGRESAIQKAEWAADGWLRLAEGGHEPRLLVHSPLPEHRFDECVHGTGTDHFDEDILGIHLNTLREPAYAFRN